MGRCRLVSDGEADTMEAHCEGPEELALIRFFRHTADRSNETASTGGASEAQGWGGTYPAQRPAGTKPTTSAADRQLAQVINLLMSHAQQWSDQHWRAFLEVVQNLGGSREPAAATE
jgi:hypothetical protein